jgi:hypothetical protein
MKKFFIMIFLLAVSVNAVCAGTGAASFLREGVSAKETAMGGAGTAGAEGVNAAYWNPAGLTRMGTYYWQAATMYSIETYDRHYAYIAAARQSEDTGNMAVSFINYGVGKIDIYDESGTLTGTKGNMEYLLGFTYANKINYQVRYGLTLKGLYQDLVGYKGTGYGADLGFVFQPLLDQEIFFGIMLQNVLGLMAWEGYNDDLMTSYKFGGSGSFFDGVFGVSFDVIKEETADALIFREGLEFKVLDYGFIRGGLDGLNPAAGLGIQYGGYKIDYAYSYDKYGLGDKHQISLVFMW